MATTNTNTNSEVSIPSKRFINKIKNNIGNEKSTVGYKWCKNHVSDDIIYTTLNECNMDLEETCRRLTVIYDVHKISSESTVDEVCTMLKECNMDPSEATQRLLYIATFQHVKTKKDARKTASNGDAVQEAEKKEDTGKTVSNGDTVQEAEKKEDTGKTVSNGDTVQEAEKKKETGKTVRNGNTVQELEKKQNTGKTVRNGHTIQEVQKKQKTGKTVHKADFVHDVEKKKDMQKIVNQSRGASQERKNFYSSKVYNDGKRNLTSGKGYGVTNNHVKREWRPKSPDDYSKEANSSSAGINGKLANNSHSHKVAPKPSSVTVVKHTSTSAINTHSASKHDVTVVKQTNTSAINTHFGSDDFPKLDVTVVKQTTASAISTHSASNELKQSSPKLDVMQKKLNVSSRQSVIFPDRLHVPQNCKTEFVFGSLGATCPTKPSSRLDDRTAKSGRAT